MRFSKKSVAAIIFFVVAFFLVGSFIIPKVYLLKEPFFRIPIDADHEIITFNDIPIRNDEYGDGEFYAKRRGGRKHLGIDLEAPIGSPVYASKSGIAQYKRIPNGYGNLIIINHFNGWQTRYGHLKESFIKNIKWVSQGEQIGTIGKTGNADVDGMIPHIHFEIRHKGNPVDPAKEFIRRGE